MGTPRMKADHPSAVVIYHFYPHYRKPVVEALARSTRADFTFVGDDHEYLHSIEPATLGPDVRFRLAPTHHLFGPFMWQWGAIAWAVRSGFDTVIMHAVPHWPCTWIGALLARMLGRRVFFWGHGYLSRPRGLKGLLRRLFYAVPTDHMVYSRLAKAYLVASGWPAERVHVIWNSLDTEAQARVREAYTPERTRRIRTELFGESDTPVIICTSRLISMRRLDLLLEAVARLRDGGTAANVVLVGDGPERASLQAQAQRLGVRVHFEGACYDEARLGALIMSSNVTVSPGKTGLTAVHSIGYGIPVVSHDDPDDQGPEYEAIIPGRTGSLYRRGDVASLADAIKPWLAGALTDPQVRAACIAFVERFWNPAYQRRAIERAVCGQHADDLFDRREVV
jgi:glycosyltransferase involved in cell wall biosynthesis